jgi:branched-chain amino acid aminotransferase
MKIWIDGNYYSREEARISVFDHGLLYGDGVFEGIRVYGGSVFKLKDHVDRLYRSAKAIFLEIPLSRDEMMKTVIEVTKENSVQDGYIRLVVTRGTGELGMNPFLCPRATIIIIAGEISFYPEKCYSEGIAVITSSLRRIGPGSFDVRIKSLNYLNNLLAKIEAIQAGCLEALLLNNEGNVSECTGDNVFICTEGVLETPPATDQALEGITRDVIMKLAAEAGIPVRETSMTQYDLYTADECFLTGTGAEIMPVTKIDGRVIGDGMPGPVTRKVMKRFNKLVRRGKKQEVRTGASASGSGSKHRDTEKSRS